MDWGRDGPGCGLHGSFQAVVVGVAIVVYGEGLFRWFEDNEGLFEPELELFRCE